MRSLKFSVVMVFCGLLALLSGCVSTQLKSSWRAGDDQGPKLRKVAVFMLTSDENVRRFAEDQMVRSLPKGTKGTAGYSLFDKPESNIETIREKLQEKGFDSILMARTVSVDKTQHQVPPTTQVVPTGPLLVGVGDPKSLDVYYRHVWGYTYQTTPGYLADLTTIVIETVLYRLPSGQAVWSAVSETRNPTSQADMVQELVVLIDKQLTKEGLVAEN